jgi:hypothetical protein
MGHEANVGTQVKALGHWLDGLWTLSPSKAAQALVDAMTATPHSLSIVPHVTKGSRALQLSRILGSFKSDLALGFTNGSP